ncbi:MAG: HdeD family acid-resistance protein [Acidiferrobacterales bacterium]
MAAGVEATVSAAPPGFGALQRNWGWLLGLGIVFIILGAIGLGMLFALTLASVVFFGVLLLIGGGVQFADAFKCKGWKGVVWHVLMAVLYVVAGIAVITDPVLASALLTLVLAGTIAGAGIVRVILAFQHRGSKGWVWTLVSGIISILLGLIIFAKWPVSGLWVIGLFVAIELIISGWSYVLIALAARRAGRAPVAGPEGPQPAST